MVYLFQIQIRQWYQISRCWTLTAYEQREEDHATTPYVYGLGRIWLVPAHLGFTSQKMWDVKWKVSTNLRSEVWQAPTSFIQHTGLAGLLELVYCRQPEVGYLEGPRCVQQQIFRLEVSMTNTLGMDILLRS